MPKSLEKALFPKSNKLIKKKDCYVATIVDVELDPIECVFQNDGCVEIDIKQYAYITLTKANLYRLIGLIEEAEINFETDELMDKAYKKTAKK